MVYLVWGYDQYYPTGPDDLLGVYATREEAEAHLSRIKGFDYTNITSYECSSSTEQNPNDQERYES
jgi:hypothetical protein